MEQRQTDMPKFLYSLIPRVVSSGRRYYCENREAAWTAIRHEQCESTDGFQLVDQALKLAYPNAFGWSNIVIPDKQTLVSDAGKLAVLDSLLTRLKAQGHRVLIYSQMTKMIDLLEEYMWHRKHRYMRLDGSSKISARRDMVADFQNRADIFVFLLSTRAGGLGINLTAADTVIFYDSDWNPTVDQQAMDRAHRLGQTKQVTVYRLICKGTIEERILQRAREKSEIQRMVISGGNFKPDTLKPKEVVSLLLDDEEIELKYRQKTEERKFAADDVPKNDKERDRKRKQNAASNKLSDQKKNRTDGLLDAYDLAFLESGAPSPALSEQSNASGHIKLSDVGNRGDESSNDELMADCDSTSGSHTPVLFSTYDGLGKQRKRHHPRGTKRGRPRGSRRGGGSGSAGRTESTGVAMNSNDIASTSDVPVIQQLPQVKRGPGRPRLKPNGPSHQGYRSHTRSVPRPRKPVGPLVVPLGQSPAATPIVRSPALSPAQSPARERVQNIQTVDEDNT